MKFEVGTILKLSPKGLAWLARDNAGKRAKLATYRFEYRCPSRKMPECITVKILGGGYYMQYYHEFLELA